MIDFTTDFQVRARTQEEANAIMEALHAAGCKWNGGDKLSATHSNWDMYNTETIYDVWHDKGNGGRVLYGSRIDQSMRLYSADELLQELYGEDSNPELNIESLL